MRESAKGRFYMLLSVLMLIFSLCSSLFVLIFYIWTVAENAAVSSILWVFVRLFLSFIEIYCALSQMKMRGKENNNTRKTHTHTHMNNRRSISPFDAMKAITYRLFPPHTMCVPIFRCETLSEPAQIATHSPLDSTHQMTNISNLANTMCTALRCVDVV